MMMMIIIIIIIKSRNYRKQPYWALHTYFGKYLYKRTVDLTLQIALYAP
jgi:hypothetical protein